MAKAKTEVPREAHKADWEYVTVPEKDIFDIVFEGPMINQTRYGPGTHLVPPDIAGELRRILARWTEQNISILQPKKDKKALRDLQGAGRVQAEPAHDANVPEA